MLTFQLNYENHSIRAALNIHFADEPANKTVACFPAPCLCTPVHVCGCR